MNRILQKIVHGSIKISANSFVLCIIFFYCNCKPESGLHNHNVWPLNSFLTIFFHLSSENLFENKVKNGQSTSATPDRELLSQRRSSTSSTSSGTGIRTGGGLIETGKPVTQSFLPFGSTATKKGPNYVIKKGSRSRSQSRPPPAVPTTNPQTSVTNNVQSSVINSSTSR